MPDATTPPPAPTDTLNVRLKWSDADRLRRYALSQRYSLGMALEALLAKAGIPPNGRIDLDLPFDAEGLSGTNGAVRMRQSLGRDYEQVGIRAKRSTTDQLRACADHNRLSYSAALIHLMDRAGVPPDGIIRPDNPRQRR